MMLSRAFRTIHGIFRRSLLDDELDDEIRTHLEMACEEYVSRGLTPEQAMRTARRDFGRVERAREGHRDARGVPGLGDLGRDIRISGRGLLRRPAFTIVAVATLGLGIAATTTVFAVVDGVLLRPLPYEDPGTLVAVGAVSPGQEGLDQGSGLQRLGLISFPNFLDYRDRARSFEWLAALMPFETAIGVGDSAPETVPIAGVTTGLFEMLGAEAALGRAFQPQDYRPELPEAAMISYRTWQRRFGGDPDVLGRIVRVDGVPVPATIVGVLTEDFAPPEAFIPREETPEYWLPLLDHDRDAWIAQSRREREIYLIGRLAPGATVEQARAEAERIAAELAAEYPGDNVDGRTGLPIGIGINGLQAQTIGSTGRGLGLFLGAAALLLLLAAMNTATLVLARSMDRTGEFGVRMALGAGRGRIVRLLLGEAVLLAGAGGALGVLLAYGGVGLFLRYAPASIPRLSSVALDERILVVAAVVTVGAAVVTGLLPALRTTRGGPRGRLQRAGHSIADDSSRLRGTLVSGQAAVAVVLLSGAGLLFSSFVHMRTGDELGFRPGGLIAMGVEVKGAASWNDQAPWLAWDVLLDDLRSVPGVESAGATSNAPFESPKWMPSLLLAGDPPETVRSGIAGYAVTPGYLETLGTRLLRGRGIEASDRPETERVALVNETFVRTQLGGAEAVGAVVRWSAGTEWSPGDEWIPPEEWLVGEPAPIRIVGVVEDVVQTRVGEGPRAAIYLPYTQARPFTPRAAIRTALPPETLFGDLRGVAGGFNRLDPDPVLMLSSLAPPDTATLRFQLLLVGAFALVAMLLAAVGLYGSLAHSVRRRQRELGVRIALGADRGGVLRMVLGQGLRISLIGLVLGVSASLLLTRLLGGLLYGVEPNDPVTLAAAGAAMALVSVAASLVPAYRATAVDPMRTLRVD